MEEKIFLEELTNKGVSILRKKYVVLNGIEYQIGEPFRCSYENSVTGRTLISENLPEPYYSAVMLVWGNQPTVNLE